MEQSAKIVDFMTIGAGAVVLGVTIWVICGKCVIDLKIFFSTPSKDQSN